MTRKTILVTTAIAAALGLGALGSAVAAGPGWSQGQGQGQNMDRKQNAGWGQAPCTGDRQGFGPGMMQGRDGKGPGGAGMRQGRGGPGMMGTGPRAGNAAGWPGAAWADADRDGMLSADEVKASIDRRHATRGLPFTVTVADKDAETLNVEIKAADGTAIRTFELPKKVEAAARTFGRQAAGSQGRQGFAPRGNHGHHAHGDGIGPGYRLGLLADGEVTEAEVATMARQRLARWNNPNLKLGKIEKNDQGVITARIVTQDDSLVQSFQIDSRTGRPLAPAAAPAK